MKALDTSLADHLAGRSTTLALCWRVTRRDGVLLLGTEHDRNLTIDSGPRAGVYQAKAGITGSSIKSGSDLAVDNLEVMGALKDDLLLLDLSAADIEAGLFDVAQIQTFLVNWQAPDDGQAVLRTGTLGDISRKAEGQYRAELRGLWQLLSQVTVRTYGTACDADLGDARCTVDLGALTVTGIVTVVTSRRRFDGSLSLGSPAPVEGHFVGGILTFTSGPNSGYAREVKQDAAAGNLGELEFLEPFPVEPDPGDTFNLSPGCDKLHATCRDRFNNLLNFRGHGHFVPGQTEILKVGGT